MAEPLLEMRGITKTFPGVVALDEVHLRVRKGEIHALVGENGAGKSTLMKVLSGVYPHGTYSGEIYYDGTLCTFRDIKQSEQSGIVIIHQELALIPYLSIAENIFLSNERSRTGIIDWHATRSEARKLMERVGLDESPDTLVMNIGVGKQQLVEIAKALAKDAKLLILDEPTAALNEDDSENLLRLLVELKRQGISSILISHKLNEVLQIADSITVLRDGKTIETMDAAKDQVTEDRIIKGMVGRDLTQRYPERTPKIGETLFEVRNWNVYHPLQPDRQIIHDVNISLRKGEIVGIAGLMGAGRTEFAMSLFGRSYGKKISGQLIKNGQPIDVPNISAAIRHGIAYVTEDRKNYGLILIDDIKRNISLANLRGIARRAVVQDYLEVQQAEIYREKLRIKTPNVHQLTGNLSGGNQQKVVLSKWIYAEPDILILDEPTRGIDVGAKYEIYMIIQQLADEGKGILVISSELPELLGICDRIYAMCEGRITGELMREEADQEILMRYMTKTGGGKVGNAEKTV